MKKIVRFLSAILCIAVLTLSFAACVKNSDEDESDPTATPEAEVEYEPETTDYVAKINDMLIYENEFYYFLYQGISDIYYNAEGVYDETLTDDENLERMREYFYSTAEDGETYLQKAANRALEIAQCFKIAYSEGKKLAESNSDYEITDEEIEKYMSYIDSEAEYAASVYGTTGDEYFLYYYGMNVNDVKRYTRDQLYAAVHEENWLNESGYVIGVEKPTEVSEPEKPADLDDDATDEEKAEYETALEQYNKDVAAYDDNVKAYNEALEAYNKACDEYWAKFEDEFNESSDSYTVKTVRYLLLDKTDDDGELLTDEEIEEKRKSANSYIDLVKDGTFEFEGFVKGFSESSTASSDLGLSDIDVYNASISVPENVAKWAIEQDELSTEPVLIETDDAIYVVMLVGITDFYEQKGIAYSSSYTVDSVRENVETQLLTVLYNEYVESFMSLDEYQLTDINNDRCLELAKEYLEYSES